MTFERKLTPKVMTELQTLFLFEPYYKSVIWGGEKIAALKCLNPSKKEIGESWEISAVPGFESIVANGKYKGLTIKDLINKFGKEIVGEGPINKWGNTFPLLIKIIDAAKDLSIQVHPDDSLAAKLHNARGKTEMWYIIDAAPDSVIYSGLENNTDEESFRKMAEDGTIINSLSAYPVKKGQFYYIPAGTVHAIGAGVMVAEIQETSDISYRIFDYNRVDSEGNTRPLHIDAAVQAINFSSEIKEPVCTPESSCTGIIESDFFNVDFIKPDKGNKKPLTLKGAKDSFSILIAVHSPLKCNISGNIFDIPLGSSALIPACVNSFEIEADEAFLRVSLPPII